MASKQPLNPFVIRNLIDDNLLSKLQNICTKTRNNKSAIVDSEQFFRSCVHNHPVLRIIHSEIALNFAKEYFKEDLKPSYVFMSLYEKGKGVCPVHIDRPQCYRTLDLCINQNEPWPIHVQLNDKESKTFLLEPGDALFYSGTDSPHWRERIQPDNFCDLIFFHFVKSDFEGSLD